MSKVDSLRKCVAALKARSNRDWIPRTWCFVLEVGEELPPEVQANINKELRENDEIYIRHTPKGFLGTTGKEGDWSWGYVTTPGGGASIICPDGTLKKVRKH